MSRNFYLVFLSIASAGEVGCILGLNNGLVEIVYFFLLVYVIINYIFGRVEPWLWSKGLVIIGLTSLASLILMMFDQYTGIIKKIESVISLYVWIRSVKYMADWGNKNLEE